MKEFSYIAHDLHRKFYNFLDKVLNTIIGAIHRHFETQKRSYRELSAAGPQLDIVKKRKKDRRGCARHRRVRIIITRSMTSNVLSISFNNSSLIGEEVMSSPLNNQFGRKLLSIL